MSKDVHGGEVMKKDDGKNRTDLLPVYPLEQVAAVLTFGAKKYDAHRWRKGMEWSRLYGAILRHVFAWFRGQDTDPETGLSHLAHAITNLMFLLEYSRTGAGTDDREGKLKDAAVPGPGIPFVEDGGVYRQKDGGLIVLFSDESYGAELSRRLLEARKFGSIVGWNPTDSYTKEGLHMFCGKYTTKENSPTNLVEKIGKV